ncbi:MAG: nickel pincer cofactor biosynthesis protein LarC [Dethiobacteria bacterium]
MYFDCSAGAAGDMILASLLDCGASLEKIKEKLSMLPLGGYDIKTFKTRKKGLAALRLQVKIIEQQPPRHLPQIKAIINSSTLPDKIKEQSLAIFHTLARAEARVHGISEEKVHFHEIGAVDSIIDVLGTTIALEMLGIGPIYASYLPLGSGWTVAGHGKIPLPAPATMEIIKINRIPCYGLPLEGETVTPTGAAILGTICRSFTPIPPMIVEKIGYGAGSKEFDYPNIIRAMMGTSYPGTGKIETDYQKDTEEEFLTEPLEILEANIDDLNPEIYDYVLDRLFSSGALDVYFTPVQMKKNRPAVKITVLAAPHKSHELGQILLRETSTLGYRRRSAEKVMLPRIQKIVETPWGNVRVKIAGSPQNYFNIAPEYEDCLLIAREKAIPLKKIYQEIYAMLKNI